MNQQQEIILNKAIQLFGQYGVKNITMNDVAVACGMSKKTIYNLFENKDDLIQTFIAQLTTGYTQSYRSICEQSANAVEEVLASVEVVETAFRQINHRLVTELYKYHFHTWQKIESFRDAVVLDFIRSNLTRGQAQGYYHQCFDNDTIAAMRLRELNSLHGSYEELTDRFRLQQVLTQVAFHYMAGIASPKGVQLLKKKYKITFPPKADYTTPTK